jgi:dihydroflavonol-4-reductase
MELPYIVGVTPTKGSLWHPLVKYVNSVGRLKFYTKGGTAVASVRNVGVAVVNALELTKENSIYQVVDVNMTWKEWLQSLSLDPTRKLTVITIPTWLVKLAALGLALFHKLKGLEGGLSIVPFIDLQARNTFLPIDECVARLKYQRYDIQEDFRNTVHLCMNKNPENLHSNV